MIKTLDPMVSLACGLMAALLLVLSGCSKPAGGGPTASTPKQAATQLQQAFATANVEVKNQAEAASQALRTADYEKAIQSLAAIEARQNLTLEQGMAVYNSSIALVAHLVAAMEAGDPNAKRAYELLKASRRN